MEIKWSIMKIYLKTTLLFVFGCFILVALPASAAGLVPCAGPDCNMCKFLQLISDVTRFIVIDIMAPLAGLMFLVSGIMMVSAGGNESRFKKGKEILKETAIGVLIILASWVIVNTLITALAVNVDGFVPGNWWTVNCQ